MSDNDITHAEWRGRVIATLSELNKNDDLLHDRMKELEKRFSKNCIMMENRLVTLEQQIMAIEALTEAMEKYKRWLIGILITTTMSFISILTAILVWKW